MSESGLKLLVWMFTAASMGALLLVPQPIAPWEMPSLQLRRSDVAAARRADEAKGEGQLSQENARALRDALLRHGAGEIVPQKGMHADEIAKIQAHEIAKKVHAAHGATGIDAARVQSADAFEAALIERIAAGIGEREQGRESGSANDEKSEADLDENDRILGGFMRILAHYGALDGNVLVAPTLSLRAMYKARWNAIFGRPLTEGLVTGEERAYWGWLALHAGAAPWALRERAVVQYRKVGGLGAAEASAMIAMVKGGYSIASKVLEQTYASRGTLRLRNLALGALAISQQPSAKPRVDTPARIP